MKINKILETYYENTVKLFDKNYTDFVDDSNIDYYLNKEILQIDSQSEIIATYRGKNNTFQTLILNKNNFYNGYCDKIWKNLSIAQRAQVAKWHFDYLYHRYNFERVEFMFFIAMKKEATYSFANTGATHYVYPIDNPKKNKIIIEINPEMLFDENQ